MIRMFVADTTKCRLPPHLEQLLLALNRISPKGVTEYDLVVAVLYVLMLECGFSPCDLPVASSDSKNIGLKLENIETVPSFWRDESTGLYSMPFTLDQFDYRCRLIGIPSGDILIVNLIVGGLPGYTYSMTICCKFYVSLMNLEWHNPRSAYMQLRELSVKFKNNVAVPARSAILNEEGILNGSLLGLPVEIKLKILGYLGPRDLVSVSATCKYLNHLANTESLWKGLVMREKPKVCLSKKHVEGSDWKTQYKHISALKVLLENCERKTEMYIRRQYEHFMNQLHGCVYEGPIWPRLYPKSPF